MLDLTGVLALVTALSVVNQRLVQHVTGSWLSGGKAVLASWIGGFAVTFAAYSFPDLAPGTDILSKLPLGEVFVIGALVGLGSNGIHEVFEKLIPAVNDHALMPVPAALKDITNTDPIIDFVHRANQVSIDFQTRKITKAQAQANIAALAAQHKGDPRYPPLFYPAFMDGPTTP